MVIHGPATLRAVADLFFDLDGTLTDSRIGITRCIQHALEKFGVTPPEAESLERWIGPPLSRAFEVLLETRDEARVRDAVEAYRERFREVGIFENRVYPGIEDALARLCAQEHTLFVVTSKPTVFAEQILDHFDLAKHFDACHGADLAGTRSDKETLVRTALADGSLDAAAAWMIGDREHDVLAARAAGVRSVGVTWGFGSQQELREAAPDHTIDSPGALVTLFGGTDA